MKMVTLLNPETPDDQFYPEYTDEMIESIPVILEGNTKTGKTGRHASIMLKTSSIPVKDCPGAGECKRYCYAILLYLRNSDPNQKRGQGQKLYSYLANKNPKKLLEKMTKELEAYNRNHIKPVLRIHEQGDMVSVPHILVYFYLALRFPNIQFYGYSHNFHQLKEQRFWLEKINELPNVHIRESLDTEMEKSYYSSTYFGKKKPDGYIDCPEQTKGIQCADCGICWRAPKAQVYFKLHGVLAKNNKLTE